MSDNTTLYAGIVIALIVGAAVGYFVYPSMNPSDTVEDTPEPKEPDPDHNHIVIYFLVLGSYVLHAIVMDDLRNRQ